MVSLCLMDVHSPVFSQKLQGRKGIRPDVSEDEKGWRWCKGETIPSNGTIRRDDLTNNGVRFLLTWRVKWNLQGEIPLYMTCKMKSPGGNSAYMTCKMKFPGGNWLYMTCKMKFPGGNWLYMTCKLKFPGGNCRYMACKLKSQGWNPAYMACKLKFPGGNCRYMACKLKSEGSETCLHDV